MKSVNQKEEVFPVGSDQPSIWPMLVAFIVAERPVSTALSTIRRMHLTNRDRVAIFSLQSILEMADFSS